MIWIALFIIKPTISNPYVNLIDIILGPLYPIFDRLLFFELARTDDIFLHECFLACLWDAFFDDLLFIIILNFRENRLCVDQWLLSQFLFWGLLFADEVFGVLSIAFYLVGGDVATGGDTFRHITIYCNNVSNPITWNLNVIKNF